MMVMLRSFKFSLVRSDKHDSVKRIVKRAELCKCDIRLVSRIFRHKRIIPFV